MASAAEHPPPGPSPFPGGPCGGERCPRQAERWQQRARPGPAAAAAPCGPGRWEPPEPQAPGEAAGPQPRSGRPQPPRGASLRPSSPGQSSPGARNVHLPWGLRSCALGVQPASPSPLPVPQCVVQPARFTGRLEWKCCAAVLASPRDVLLLGLPHAGSRYHPDFLRVPQHSLRVLLAP